MNIFTRAMLVCSVAVLSSSCATNTDKEFQSLDREFSRHFTSSQKLSIPDTNAAAEEGSEDAQIPDGFRPAWHESVMAEFRDTGHPVPVTVDSLETLAIHNSSQIITFSHIPLVRGTAIGEAKGAFETRFFAKGRYDVIDEPAGTVLQTLQTRDYEEESWSIEAGFKKKLATGGSLEFGQRIGHVDNTSDYFSPSNQARTKLYANLTQPLLNGAGWRFNSVQTRLAEIDTAVGEDEFQRQVEAHLLELSRSYWSLYLERTRMVLQDRLVTEARGVTERIAARGNVDALKSQIARAEAELATRSAETVRARTAVLNAEARIRTLVNGPDLGRPGSSELVPATEPTMKRQRPDLRESMLAALQNRPELSQLVRQFQASTVRVDAAKSQLLPYLNFIVEAYVSGLAADHDMGEAFGDQNTDHLNYMIGLVLDVPLTRRTAKARHERRQLEMRQLVSKLDTTAETILLEVEVSIREIDASYQEMAAYYQSMMAARSELDALAGRSSLADDAGTGGSHYLEQLLDSQRRMAVTEERFARSLSAYNLALVNLDRATGSLTSNRNIKPSYGKSGKLPTLSLERK